MEKRGRRLYRPKGAIRRLRLGAWLDRLGIKQGALADAVGVSAGYISELVNPKPKDIDPNPSPQLLLAISDFLEITVNELYQEPPSRDAMEKVRKLTPAQQALMARILDAEE